MVSPHPPGGSTILERSPRTLDGLAAYFPRAAARDRKGLSLSHQVASWVKTRPNVIMYKEE
jgi:hypothetical protein